MKLTARNDQVTIKSQSKPDFASRKYGHWRKTASGETSKVRALISNIFDLVNPYPQHMEQPINL